MAQFVITAYDGEGMLDKRMEVRPLLIPRQRDIREGTRMGKDHR